MDKKKKYIISILMLIFVFIIIIVWCLNSNKEPVTFEPPTDNNQTTKRFEKVNNYEEFFDIQSTLNDISNINITNSYTIEEIYINGINNTYYYFINSSMFDEYNYEKNVYWLLILDNNTKSYKLSKITEKINNLQEYAKNYNIKELDIVSSNKFISNEFSTNNLLTIYMEYFKQLLIYDVEKAYNMLSENSKNNYYGYEDFVNKAFNIYSQLSSQIFSYHVNNDNNANLKNVYSFEDNNRNKISIYEESIMNFKISF